MELNSAILANVLAGEVDDDVDDGLAIPVDSAVSVPELRRFREATARGGPALDSNERRAIREVGDAPSLLESNERSHILGATRAWLCHRKENGEPFVATFAASFALDAPASMSPYARATLRCTHSTKLSQRRGEALTHGTRCTSGIRKLSWRILPARQLARLAIVAHRVMFVTPLQTSLEYEPREHDPASAPSFTDKLLVAHSFDLFDAFDRFAQVTSK